MATENPAPETLLEAVRYFTDKDAALAFVVALRWPDGVTCPDCDHKEVSFLSTRRIWKCLSCKRQFSVKRGSIFEDSPIGLEKWLPALWLIVNCKNGISSYELARDLKVTQKTAWFMLHRIRLAMQAKSFNKLGGEIEIDETYIGGKARNMHKSKRARLGMARGRTYVGKVAVMGLLQRHAEKGESRIRLETVAEMGPHIRGRVREHVESGSTVYTDALTSYKGLDADYVHNVIDHAECYAEGQVHTNGLENFWSLLKRSIKGTYVSVEPFHLFRCLDEQAFRFNNRKATDAVRFTEALASIFGKRLTYAALTGHAEPERN